MKNIQHIYSNPSPGNKIPHHQPRVAKPKLSTGSVIGMYPVVLDDGRTIIYIRDKNKEGEIRSRYESHK